MCGQEGALAWGPTRRDNGSGAPGAKEHVFMKIAHSAALILALGALSACKSSQAPPAALSDFTFSRPCAELSGFFADKGIETRGDPTGVSDHLSLLLDHGLFRVVEVRCARLAG